MRQELSNTDGTKDRPAQPDLSAEIIQSVPKDHNQRVTCLHVCGNNYRCNWWSPAPTRDYDNPKMRGPMVTTHIVAKSRFLNVVKLGDRLQITDASSRPAAG